MAMKEEAHKQETEQVNSEERHERDNSLDRDEELPTYQESTPGPRTLQPESTNTNSTNALGPTVSSPFNFPTTSQAPPPEYSSPSSSQRPIAIPQQFPDQAAPFLPAYSPSLLNYGIPAGSWYSFLDTMSAFLTARVGKRAVSHAGDIAASVGRVPKRLGKDVVNHVKETTREIGYQAKRGNVLGVVGGVVGGTIALTVGSAAKLVGSAVSLPGTAIEASVNLKTPRERAEAYAAAANKDWFHKRGLHAHLMNTAELANLVGVTLQQQLDATNSQPVSASEQMKALRDLIEGVELRRESEPKPESKPAHSPSGYPADIKKPIEMEDQTAAGPSEASSSQTESASQREDPASLRLSTQTLWLVILRDSPQRGGAK